MSARDDDLTRDDVTGVDNDVEMDEGVARPTGSLAAEGIPDLEGPPGADEGSRDGDEGLIPPGDSPWVADHDDLTATAQREGSTLDERLSLEEPDRPSAPAADLGPGLDIVDEDRPDHEPDLVGTAAAEIDGAPAEELAMHVVDEAPGATDDEDTGYVAEDGEMAP